jgi:hypothetical protein
MSRRGLKWAVVGASLVLVLLGIHLAWERHRNALHTPWGTIRVGMTLAEVEAMLCPAQGPRGLRFESVQGEGAERTVRQNCWQLGSSWAVVDYDENGRVEGGALHSPGGAIASIPRPSLTEYIRFWITGQRAE